CENRRMRHAQGARTRAAVRALAAAALLFTLEESLSASSAVVTTAVQDLYVRPDETSPVDDQAIVGDRVTILEDAAGFAKVKTAAGNTAWIPERALRRLAGASAAAKLARVAHVTSNFAHVYASPSFERQKPLLTAPVGANLEEIEEKDFLEGKEEGRGAGKGPRAESDASWVRVRLPDGRIGYIAARDVALFTFEENPRSSLPL